MTTPDAPLRMELSFELPGMPEQVWQAIATAGGISSWFLPTDLDERLGGTILTHMGETDSPGTVTGWDPPQRFAYEEPDWAGLAGHADADVSPLATEFLVEAQSGGTCVVRVVSSAFGTGADWEQEFFDGMERGWRPFFDRLRLYLAHFPGQQASSLWADRNVEDPPEVALAAMRQDFGIEGVGQFVEHRGLSGKVERDAQDDVLLRLAGPVPGFFGFGAFANGEGGAVAMVNGHLFSDGAPAYAEREQAGWKSWLESLDLKSTSTSTTSS